MPLGTHAILLALAVLLPACRPQAQTQAETQVQELAPVPAQTATAAVPATGPTTTSPSADASAGLLWPRTFDANVGRVVVYQPQVESWTGNRIQCRAAVFVTPPGAGTVPAYGIISMTARTDVDKANRIVSLEDHQVTGGSFPNHKDNEQRYVDAIGRNLAEATHDIPLDQLEADLAVTQASERQKTQPVKNDPPKVIFSTTPALLVLIDGPPSLQQVQGEPFMRVINTRALILLDQPTNRYYLHAMNRWYEAADPTGPWSVAPAVVPGGMDELLDSLSASGTVDLLDPKDPAAAPETPPTIVVSTTPAELIQTDGEPQYTPVAGTNLLYANNTDSALFMYVTTRQFYALISGRWFAAPSLNGPWAYVPGTNLPADFAKIPADSPMANVLVSVPGTPQAKEAVIANSIPQTATVSIADTQANVTYDGAPQFKPIDGAAALAYAVNSPVPVIRVDGATPPYWCVQNGVWFSAPAPTGPWAVATAVPPAIYTIPTSSPIHYVTYVRVYGSGPGVVYVGYTPGYMGTVVAPDGVVVYGTGYYYPPYVDMAWVGYPPTYGWGASFAYGPGTGFGYGFAAGAALGGCWANPYWGPCFGFGLVDLNTVVVFNRFHRGVFHANRHFYYDRGIAARPRAFAFSPYSGRHFVGGYAPYAHRAPRGEFGARQAGTAIPPRGIIEGARPVPRAGVGTPRFDNNVFGGRDGNIYRHNGAQGWEQRTGRGWMGAERANPGFSEQRPFLEQQRAARSAGVEHFNAARSGGFGGGYHAAGGFHGGGGGFHGGGGGGGHR